MGSDEAALLAEQVAYYRAGAAEYDRAYAEREELQRLLALADDLPIGADVLELACGTGQWTSMLAARARSVTALDAAGEVLAIARARIACAGVQFIQADVWGQMWTSKPRRWTFRTSARTAGHRNVGSAGVAPAASMPSGPCPARSAGRSHSGHSWT